MKKKVFITVLTGMMVLSLAACGKASTTESADSTQTVSAEATITESANAAKENETAATESAEAAVSVEFPESTPSDFTFSSGVGAWSSEMTLHKDGTFFGDYHDSDMGDTGDEYPNGTVYISSFSGEFTDIQQVDELTYQMTLGTVTTDNTEGEESISDDIRYVYSSAYGVDSGSTFYLYLPGTAKTSLSEECQMWVSDNCYDENGNLSAYVIFNEEAGSAFVGFAE
jgi:hypothetical protein